MVPGIRTTWIIRIKSTTSWISRITARISPYLNVFGFTPIPFLYLVQPFKFHESFSSLHSIRPTYYKRTNNIRNREGSMKATILPHAIILTRAHRATVSMMAKGCIVA